MNLTRKHNGARPRRIQFGRAVPWVAAALLLAAAGGGGGWWWWKGPGRSTAAAARVPGTSAAPSPGGVGAGGRRFAGMGAAQPVSVETVRRQDMHVSVGAIGSMAASNTAVVRAQVSGVLQSLLFKEGQQVQAGQLLAQIDPRSFQAALSQAEGNLARDKAQLEGARVDLARYRELLAKDAIAKQQLDTQAALVAQLEGTVSADQGNVDNARLQLSYTRVSAPISGRVGLKQIDIGNIASPADANGIVTITQTRPIALVFAVPAANVAGITTQLRANVPMAVQALDRGGKKTLAEGRVAAVDNAIDAATDTIKIKALFPNADDALFPNQAVSVTMQLETLAGVLAVPQAAVLRGAQGFYVYLVGADGMVTARSVKPGAVDAGWMAVEGALQAGDRVVIDGTDRLREGAKVEVIAADPAQRAGAGRPSAAASAGAGAGAGTVQGAEGAPRPRWMEHLSPQQAAQVQAMSPEERRAWFKAQREAGPPRAAP